MLRTYVRSKQKKEGRMQDVILAIAINVNGFTGREHSQVVVLLAILALVSIVIWVLICVSILIRQGSLIILRLLGHFATRRALRAKGMHSD